MSEKKEAQLAFLLKQQKTSIQDFVVIDAWSDPVVMLCRPITETTNYTLVARPYEIWSTISSASDRYDSDEYDLFVEEQDPSIGNATYFNTFYQEVNPYNNWTSRRVFIADNAQGVTPSSRFRLRNEEIVPNYVPGSRITAVSWNPADILGPAGPSLYPGLVWMDLNIEGRVWADVTPRLMNPSQ